MSLERNIGGLARVAAALCVAALVVVPRAAVPQAQAQTPAARVAELGVELPSIGGWKWFTITRDRYFSPEVLADIRDNLHATYVRTGWIPNQFVFEKVRWYREDQAMDAICGAGLKTMIIVPGPREDKKGEQDLVDNVREFFARYTQRESGCVRYAEILNEADLPKNGFDDVQSYAAYYQRVAPIVASFGIPVITSGTSGKDLPWTAALAANLRASRPRPPVSGYGFHPYGVQPDDVAQAVLEVRRVAGTPAGGSPPPVYVTEIGQERPADLYATIIHLAHATPTITIYEYLAQPNEDPKYGLKDNPALYRAVQRAWSTLHPNG